MASRRQSKWLFFQLPGKKAVLEIITIWGFCSSLGHPAECWLLLRFSGLFPCPFGGEEAGSLTVLSLERAAGGSSTSTLRATVRMTWGSGKEILVLLDNFRKDCFHAKTTRAYMAESWGVYTDSEICEQPKGSVRAERRYRNTPMAAVHPNSCSRQVCQWSHLPAQTKAWTPLPHLSPSVFCAFNLRPPFFNKVIEVIVWCWFFFEGLPLSQLLCIKTSTTL